MDIWTVEILSITTGIAIANILMDGVEGAALAGVFIIMAGLAIAGVPVFPRRKRSAAQEVEESKTGVMSKNDEESRLAILLILGGLLVLIVSALIVLVSQ